MFVIVSSIFFMGLIASVTYEAYHFTESVGFCGEVCHSVMNPEYTAYQQSPHARVTCAECHVGLEPAGTSAPNCRAYIKSIRFYCINTRSRFRLRCIIFARRRTRANSATGRKSFSALS